VNNKPWFNGECKVKRDEFHNARKKYASSKTPGNKILLNTRAKEYRLVMNANYNKYNYAVYLVRCKGVCVNIINERS
jgi:hypothetical protein